MSNFSIKILFFTLSIIGLLCIPFLPYKLIPDNTYPSLKISYSWPNASQHTIENKVTSKLEGTFSTIKNIKNIYSKSYSDHGEIFLEYDKSVDIEKERFNVSTIIRQVYSGLPEEVRYPKISYQRPDNNDIRLLSYSIISKKDNQNIKNFIDKTLTPDITKNESVNSVTFEGIPTYYYEIKYNRNKINSLGITKSDIRHVIESLITVESLGSVVDNRSFKSKELMILSNTDQNEDYLYNLPLKKIDSKIIKLKDVASLKRKRNTDINLFRINGMNTISFSVIADKSANQIKLANTIKKNINELENNNSEYDFILTSDATSFLKKELKNIFFRTLISFLFLFIFTLIIYRNLFYVINLFISLIATLLIAALLFYIFKIDIHIYSLMSLAISIGFIIDNSIITIDHYLRNKNRKIILPIFAATLTTIAPLLFITSLDNSIKLNLIDFSWALIIVLTSSLFVSFFLIPSILKQTKHSTKKWKLKKVKKLHSFNYIYLNTLLRLRKFRVILSIVLIFLFGLPFFLLPESIEGDSLISKTFNRTFGNEYYITEIKPHTDKYLGGVLKLFIENSSNQNFIENPKRLSISVRINTPFGSTKNYINNICNKFEESLKLNKSLGIDFFQTQIYNNRAAQIDVYINPDKESSNFPFKLKGYLEKESLTTSGVDYSIFGVGKPFGTAIGESFDSNIILTGYDYEKLNSYATLVKKRLEENNRIDNVIIKSEVSWFLDTNKKYVINAGNNKEVKNVLNDFYENYYSKEIGSYKIGENTFSLKLSSNIINNNSSYSILNNPFHINDSVVYKPRYNFNINLVKVPEKIVKNNQEYQLALQYQFKGTYNHSKLIRTEIIDEFKNIFISGFNIKDGEPTPFNSENKNLYLPLLVCIFIIFSICTILLESFKKSLLIILIIPVTFIGVFASLYHFEIGFNQGVYSALILLVGLLVNSSIFIINEYVDYNKKYNSQISYIKAFNKKIIPVIITIISTIVGLTPFLISNSINNFWHPFAITICIGLTFSIFVIVFILPIYLISNKQV